MSTMNQAHPVAGGGLFLWPCGLREPLRRGRQGHGERGKMRTRLIARAIIDVLRPPADSTRADGYPWYHAVCIAIQLRQRGVTVRVDDVAREMVLGERITLPLYSQEAVQSHPTVMCQARLPGMPDTLLVRAVDLAAIPYRYCFGDAQVPRSRAERCSTGGALLATAHSVLRTGWRLLALLTPSPTEVLRAWRRPWSPPASVPECDCVSLWPYRGAKKA
jgi:hypothetical protein